MARASGPALFHGRDDVEPVAVAEPHVDDRKGRRGLLDLQQPVGDRFGGGHRKAAALHGAREPLQERFVIFDDQKRTLVRNRSGRVALVMAILLRQDACDLARIERSGHRPVPFAASAACNRCRQQSASSAFEGHAKVNNKSTIKPSTHLTIKRPGRAGSRGGERSGRSKSARLQVTLTVAPCSGGA